MKATNDNQPIGQPVGQPSNVLPLAIAPKPRPARHDARFTITEFTNRGSSLSYRVAGYKRDGTRVRENFSELLKAQARQLALETEYVGGHQATAMRATKLTDEQVDIAEAIFLRLDNPRDALVAVDYWLSKGKQEQAPTESPRLDDAWAQFKTWLDTAEMRELSKTNLRRRGNIFVGHVRNMHVADVTPDVMDQYLAKRNVSPKSRDNDRRAISRFFSWCIERPRRWATTNPCRKERSRKNGDTSAPEVLSVDECEALLRKAETHKQGALAPYVSVCLFAGLRPFEAARLTWQQVNLTDKEIRLEGAQTKTGKPRVVTIGKALARWLTAHKNKPFFPENWRRDFDEIKAAAGYGNPDRLSKEQQEETPKLKRWPVDVMRHTAISHYFRQTGSYGQTAEQFGNSEAIVKNCYQGRVTSKETKMFYAILPKKGAAK